MLPAVEALALAGLLLHAFLSRRLRPGRFSRPLRWLQGRRKLSMGILFAAGTLGSGGLGLVSGFPPPRVSDEFSYLLASDTFSKGRLTNPTHPLWQHFDTVHVIHTPTYASKYPPAQGGMLALGRLAGGDARWGVWLGVGLASAATYWMLCAWVPPRWALIAGLLFTLRFILHGRAFLDDLRQPAYWSQSYYGGALAALGGALVFGALRRWSRRSRPLDGVWLGLGLVVLANTRPFEGMVSALPAAAACLYWLGTRPERLSFLKAAVPAVMVLALGAAFLGHYNREATGNPFVSPYVVHEAMYAATPLFLWAPPKEEPKYSDESIRRVYVEWPKTVHLEQRTARGFLVGVCWKALNQWTFYLGIALTIPFLASARMRKDGWTRFAWIACGLVAIALLMETWALPHYAAPVTCLVVFLVAQGLRVLSTLRWKGKRLGRFIVSRGLGVAAISLLLGFGIDSLLDRERWHIDRARILDTLSRDGDRHLVIVRYGETHPPHNEWVYNEADIDASRVVWARDLGAERRKELLAYFRDRKVWVVEADRLPREPRPLGEDP